MTVIDLESGIIGEFIKAGLVPDECLRIIIDIPLEETVRMYYEVFADGEKLKRIDLAGLLKAGLVPPASVAAIRFTPTAGEIPREAGVNPPEPEGSRPEPTSAPPPPPSPPNETMTRGDPPPPKGE